MYNVCIAPPRWNCSLFFFTCLFSDRHITMWWTPGWCVLMTVSSLSASQISSLILCFTTSPCRLCSRIRSLSLWWVIRQLDNHTISYISISQAAEKWQLPSCPDRLWHNGSCSFATTISITCPWTIPAPTACRGQGRVLWRGVGPGRNRGAPTSHRASMNVVLIGLICRNIGILLTVSWSLLRLYDSPDGRFDLCWGHVDHRDYCSAE